MSLPPPQQRKALHPGEPGCACLSERHLRIAVTVWMTGLSGAGKSTLAVALERHLTRHGHACTVLDGDNIRRGLCSDLGFSERDREENIRRVAEVARLMNDAGLIVIAAFISPLASYRRLAQRIIGSASFREVHVATELALCERRDPKGLYRRARRGEIAQFTGIDAPYDEPAEPDLRLDTGILSVDECLERLLRCIEPFLEPGHNPGQPAAPGGDGPQIAPDR